MLLMAAFGLLVAGALVTTAYRRNWPYAGATATAFMAAASIALWWLAARAFVAGRIEIITPIVFSPMNAALVFHIDKLSAVFLTIVPFIGLAAMLYAVRYMQKMYPAAAPARYYFFAMLLMAAIVGVITSADLLFFLIFWECMTLTSWVLVWFDRDNQIKVRAAWLYFVVIHIATAGMTVGAVLIYSRTGSFAFGDIAAGIADMSARTPWLVHIVMALFLVGLSTKAGMFPFGGWLPQAHPAAPGPASAIFAGAMIKTGIYGLARMFFGFFSLPGLTVVWGAVLAVLGAASIFIGTLTALRQDDSKRVLSFHTIGQVGYMLLGLGTGLFFLRSNPFLATVGLVAGIYHAVNHACYKSLLFLNVGAAEYQTGTRDLNRMGGLGRLMPVTMAATIVASLSIAGIPPFNGYVSKWLIYQSTLHGGMAAPFFLLLAVVAIFSSVVTLASFMKVVGSMFLGNLATADRVVTGDVPFSMKLPQMALSLMCLLLGILPVVVLKVFDKMALEVLSAPGIGSYASPFGYGVTGVSLAFGKTVVGQWNPVVIVAAVAACSIAAYAISRAARAPARETVGWFCGEEHEPEEVRSRAHGFCLPFKESFAKVYPTIRIPRIPALRGPRKLIEADNWLYNPLVRAGERFTDLLSRSHSGLLQMYMLWQIIGIIAVLAIMFGLVAR
jgi:hydrogenase-4 component B